MPPGWLNWPSLPASPDDRLSEVIGWIGIAPGSYLVQILKHLPLGDNLLQREHRHFCDQINHISSIVEPAGQFEILWQSDIHRGLCLHYLRFGGTRAKPLPGMGSVLAHPTLNTLSKSLSCTHTVVTTDHSEPFF